MYNSLFNNCNLNYFYLEKDITDMDEMSKFCNNILNNYKKYDITDYNKEMAGYRQVFFLKECLNYIKKHFIKTDFSNYEITETNAGLGGFTYLLINQEFKKVNVIDIDSKRINFIKSNINDNYKQQVNNKQINYVIGNCIDYCLNNKQDIIISDFPWGGLDYKKEKNIKLSIKDSDNNDYYIEQFVKDTYLKNNFRLFLIFVPKNFNDDDIINALVKQDIPKHHIKTFTKSLIKGYDDCVFKYLNQRIIIVYNQKYNK